MHFCFECLVTDLAIKGRVLLLLMPQQVVLKCRSIPEFSRTLVTGKKSLFFVSFLVLQQMKLPVEGLVTDVAHKDLFRLSDFSFLCVLAVRLSGFCCVCYGIILCNF